MYEEYDLLFRTENRAKVKPGRLRAGLSDDRRLDRDFRCVHCRNLITTHPLLSGVNNRNHCPYCLWSRHLDLHTAGDRLAACKGGMQPVGLTLKRSNKKYTRQGQGEVMLIHLCSECGRVSINRMAADDDADKALAVFHASLNLETHLLRTLADQGIYLLGAGDARLVREQLIGRSVV